MTKDLTLQNRFKNLTFFYPSKICGGAEYLIVRLAGYLVKYGYKVNLIDYRDGFCAGLLKDHANLVPYEEHVPVTIDDDTCLITFASHIFEVKKKVRLSSLSKVLYWFVHPYNVISSIPRYARLFEYNRYRALLRFLVRKKALLFMDSENFHKNNVYFKLDLSEPEYMPLPFPAKGMTCPPCTVKEGEVNVGWLGRLSGDKIFILLYVIDKLCDLKKKNYQKNIRMHVIGEGDQANLLKDYVKTKQSIQVIFQPTLLHSNLDSYLIKNLDVLFAMGTSALEGAALRLPVILLGFSLKPIVLDYRFSWLYQSDGSCLGREIVFNDYSHALTVEDILHSVYEKNKKGEIGNACYEYFLNNHGIDHVAPKFLKFLEESALNFGDVSKLSQFGWSTNTLKLLVDLYKH